MRTSPLVVASGYLVVLAILVGCESKVRTPKLTELADGTIAFSHAGLVTDSLSGHRIVEVPALGDPQFMAISGSTLWISDRAGDPYLHAIDLKSDSLLVSRGRTGEGPGDFAEVPQLSVRPGATGAVWAYDGNLRRLTRVSSDSNPDYRVINAFGDRSQGVYSLQWQTKDQLAGIGDVDTNRITLLDSLGELRKLVPNPLLGPDSVSLAARRGISSGYFMCTQPNGGRIAVAYQAAGQIDIYGQSGEHAAMAAVPFPSDGDWYLDRRGRVSFHTDWVYYLGCSASSDYLYALFAGHRSDGPGGPTAREATHLHVFDWMGNLRAVWRLDRPLSTFVVAGDTLMYAVGQGDDWVYQYRLPPVASPGVAVAGPRGEGMR